MGHDDLLGEDLFASELDDDLLIGADLPEELDPLDEVLPAEEEALGLDDEDLLDEDDEDYSGGYNPDEWN
jgi:hypothetical protein